MKCTLSQEVGVALFYRRGPEGGRMEKGWFTLKDIMQTSPVTHASSRALTHYETTARRFCRTVFGCWRRLFADIMTVSRRVR